MLPPLSDRAFAEIFDVAPDGIVVVEGEDRTIAAANKTFCDMVGAELDQVIGRSILEFAHPDDPASTPADRARVASGQVLTKERRLVRADGRAMWCETATRMTRFGLLVMLRDIGALILEREAREQAETMYQRATAGAPIGQAIVAPDGTFRRVNPAFSRITGYPEDELIGKTFQAITHPEDLDLDVSQAALLARGDIASYTLDKRYIRRDGALIWVRLHGSAIRDADGNLLNFVAQVEDISDARAAEERLEQLRRADALRADLSNALMEHATSLPALLQVAAQKLAQAIGDACVIALIDNDRDALVPTAYHHRDPQGEEVLLEILSRPPAPLGKGFTGQVALTGKALRVSELADDQARQNVASQYQPYLDSFPVASLLIVPITSPRGGVLGTIGLTREEGYSEDQERLLTDLAGRLAEAIDNARLYEQLAEDREYLSRTNFLLRTITHRVPAIVAYWDADLSSQFANQTYEDWFGMPADRIVGSSLRDVIGEDLFEESRVHLEGALAGFRQDFDRTFTSHSGEPLHTQVSYVPDVRPDGSVAGFVELATDITSRARMQAQMTELALHDHLTGLLNRRGLSDRLAKALSDLAASGDTLSLMLCDLDDFKRINDEHGHPAGDVVLQATASRIGRLIDSQDFAARIGGDEFVVIARVRDELHADELRRTLKQTLGDPIRLPPHGARIICTSAVGMATTTDPHANPDDLIATADSRMFADKPPELRHL